MISQNKEGPCWEGFREHQRTQCYTFHQTPMLVESTPCFSCFNGANCLRERGWISLSGKQDRASSWSKLEPKYLVATRLQKPSGRIAELPGPRETAHLSRIVPCHCLCGGRDTRLNFYSWSEVRPERGKLWHDSLLQIPWERFKSRKATGHVILKIRTSRPLS